MVHKFKFLPFLLAFSTGVLSMENPFSVNSLEIPSDAPEEFRDALATMNKALQAHNNPELLQRKPKDIPFTQIIKILEDSNAITEVEKRQAHKQFIPLLESDDVQNLKEQTWVSNQLKQFLEDWEPENDYKRMKRS